MHAFTRLESNHCPLVTPLHSILRSSLITCRSHYMNSSFNPALSSYPITLTTYTRFKKNFYIWWSPWGLDLERLGQHNDFQNGDCKALTTIPCKTFEPNNPPTTARLVVISHSNVLSLSNRFFWAIHHPVFYVNIAARVMVHLFLHVRLLFFCLYWVRMLYVVCMGHRPRQLMDEIHAANVPQRRSFSSLMHTQW